MSADAPDPIFLRALERFERPLVSYAHTITGDLDSARDAVQETFLRLTRQDLASLEPRLAPWLFCVCRNCCLDHVRKIARFSPEAVDDELPDPRQVSPADHARTAEDSAQLQTLVAALPQTQRELVRLKFDAGLSYREMADVMRMSVSHVGVQLHLALQTLRRAWRQAEAPTLPL